MTDEQRPNDPTRRDEVERQMPRPDVDELALAALTEIAADEGAAISEARGRAGADPQLPEPPAGAFLAWLTTALSARSVVELGSAAGISGLWLLRGIDQRGTLTSIERDPGLRDLASQAFESAGQSDRVRAIGGEPVDVLPRLKDGAYDLVLLQSFGSDETRMLDEIRRVLRPAGVLVIRGVAVGNEQKLRSRRALVQALADDDAFEIAVLPFDGGIATATLRS